MEMLQNQDWHYFLYALINQKFLNAYFYFQLRHFVIDYIISIAFPETTEPWQLQQLNHVFDIVTTAAKVLQGTLSWAVSYILQLSATINS